ncbi:TraR/DksA family transcriptional regulator [Chromohalobacter nigrandesensis]|uniref:TraR/DksA family transcriptional regulator n=1 Tax=Chromohalobacter nigrandesensis TaxID=119863 RepID=UPI001FF4AAED|nr:TraR/DksA family transcriptional regulator [Chromohalobacter nigrandesensis]MCK0743894.1 TraR/DksA family transcriptional regulator [Chromohalobacter nigrandesensis]
MNHPDLDMATVRQQLEEKRQRLVEESQETAQSREVVELDQTANGRLTRMDAMQSQAMAKASQQRREASIRFIDLALKRIDDQNYGECIDCGEFITPKRLSLDYATLKCIDCAQ